MFVSYLLSLNQCSLILLTTRKCWAENITDLTSVNVNTGLGNWMNFERPRLNSINGSTMRLSPGFICCNTIRSVWVCALQLTCASLQGKMLNFCYAWLLVDMETVLNHHSLHFCANGKNNSFPELTCALCHQLVAWTTAVGETGETGSSRWLSW